MMGVHCQAGQTIFGAQWRPDVGLRELFWDELEGRCRQTRRFRDFLGSSAYEKLISFLGLEEDENPNPSEGTLVVPSASASKRLLTSSSEDVQEH